MNDIIKICVIQGHRLKSPQVKLSANNRLQLRPIIRLQDVVSPSKCKLSHNEIFYFNFPKNRLLLNVSMVRFTSNTNRYRYVKDTWLKKCGRAACKCYALSMTWLRSSIIQVKTNDLQTNLTKAITVSIGIQVITQ